MEVFKADYTSNWTIEPTPKARIKYAKQCEKNLKLNVKDYKQVDNKILYYKGILTVTLWYEGTHINEGIAAPTV